eukprot:CAMPEP_0201874138 /NCGR_PEP_ID=MMETSP0902-20130614/6478_1 /ASSEMBLY_ACC=CAM_ASM_000551 /TAXON_ID=420261 /ORGANISM="Thalassiosira antarctica, Strain CCMP982" /LENGTH=283 /DNA_ID=CAMNT_0048400941 /DNA_START=46 /DNA_END=897 /DNA_ORIENTATION=-
MSESGTSVQHANADVVLNGASGAIGDLHQEKQHERNGEASGAIAEKDASTSNAEIRRENIGDNGNVNKPADNDNITVIDDGNIAEERSWDHKRRARPPSPAHSQNTSDDDDRKKGDDPHNLISRFVLLQARSFSDALREIQAGEKRSCWLWFVLPTPPFVVDGIERGSHMNRHYALRTDACAVAYLRLQPQRFEGGRRGGGVVEVEVDLRRNYLDLAGGVEEQLSLRGASMEDLFGWMDAPKAVSSFRLFRRIGEEMGDVEIRDVCGRILDLVDGNTKRESSY